MSCRSARIAPQDCPAAPFPKRITLRKIGRGSVDLVAALLFVCASSHAQSTFPSTPVGTTSAAQSVTVTATAAGTVNSVEVLTSGALSGDFAGVTTRSTCSGVALAIGGTCTENDTFKPAAHGTPVGAVGLLTMLLAFAPLAGAMLATGCSGYSSTKATPGTYIIQVTGTGTNSNVVHYQNISLTITN